MERQHELADLVRRDPLTGVGNRRLLAERLRYELARHRRAQRELTLLVLDLDGFKAVNDTLGHPAGDRVLNAVGRALVATVRDGDTVVRHGGDEFCIAAPETVGIAVFPQDGPTAEVLLAAADAAERDAKAAARRAATGSGTHLSVVRPAQSDR